MTQSKPSTVSDFHLVGNTDTNALLREGTGADEMMGDLVDFCMRVVVNENSDEDDVASGVEMPAHLLQAVQE